MHHPNHRPTLSTYLLDRLQQHNIDTMFGVPGDFILKFFQLVEESPITMVNTVDEQGAGFAADAYARVRGLGVCVITWGVGGLKIANTTAQAYAEESPLIVISGAPAAAERTDGALLHHMVADFDTQLRVFEQVTVAQAVLDDPSTAANDIERVLAAAIQHKRPVYIEIPRDMVDHPIDLPTRPAPPRPESDRASLMAAVDDALDLLRNATHPIVFPGMQLARSRMLQETMQLLDATQIPVSVMPLDKSAIPESIDRFIGVYAGQMSRTAVREYVEQSDCVLLLGTLLTDTNLVGGADLQLPRQRRIHVQRDSVSIGYRTYARVRLEDFLTELIARDLPVFDALAIPERPNVCPTWQTVPNEPITVARMFQRIGCFLTDTTTVVADPGDAMFGSLELPILQDHTYLANAYYASLGFAVPASIGIQMADPRQRPLVIVGDGSFQMTFAELATSLRYGLNPIVLLLNNEGYTTERLMIDGRFNDVLPWDYQALTTLFGGGESHLVRTEDDLDRALEHAADSDQLQIIEVKLATLDVSDALTRLTSMLADAMGVAV